MRNRKDAEVKLVTDAEETKKPLRITLGIKKNKTRTTLLVALACILTIAWLCYLSSYETKVNFDFDVEDNTPLPSDKIYLKKIIKAGQLAAVENECVHKPNRDYKLFPVSILGHGEDKESLKACDIPCEYNNENHNYTDAAFDIHAKCDHVFRVAFSMESVVNYPEFEYEFLHESGYEIAATYELDSDVPLPYFGWGYNQMRNKPKNKTAPAMVAMFVSNCKAKNNRLEYVKELMDNGITVDSYGYCMHNADAKVHSENYNEVKGRTIQHYKFTIAMENSNTKDYVTEKLFTPLDWGTVPIHMGVANVHDYVPEHSVISVHDFKSPKELAEYLKELDRNETKYAEYHAWREKPYTKSFKALWGITDVHSSCRICIKTADINRLKYGPEARPEGMPTFTGKLMAENRGSLPLWIRERGKYWPVPVFVKERTVEGLKKAALDALRPEGTERRTQETMVWGIYDRYARVTKKRVSLKIGLLKEWSLLRNLRLLLLIETTKIFDLILMPLISASLNSKPKEITYNQFDIKVNTMILIFIEFYILNDK